MNAYELADYLEKIATLLYNRVPIPVGCDYVTMRKTAPMLRQQADRIAELEKPVKQLSDEEWRDLFNKMGLYVTEEFAGRIARAIIKEITE